MDGSQCAGMRESDDRVAGAAAAFLRQVLSQVSMLAGGLSVACGGVLALRRLGGAFAAPAEPEAVLTICGAGLVLVAVGDLTVRWSATHTMGPAMAWVPSVLTRVGLLVAVAAVGLPPKSTSSTDALAAVAAVVVSLVTAVRGPAADLIAAWRPRRPFGAARVAVNPLVAAASSATEEMDSSPESMPQAGLSGGSLLQRFERLALPEGVECVRGRLCVAVPKGTRSGYGHVGFCPPLASQPTVDVTSDYDGVEAIVSAAEVLPWGVRIECRLDEPAEETIEIPVDILVMTAA